MKMGITSDAGWGCMIRVV